MQIKEDKNGTVLEVSYPRYLFKFSSINENSLDAIANGYLWFSSIDEFNDPFECTRIFKSTDDDAYYEWFVTSEAGQTSLKTLTEQGLTEDEARSFIRKKLKETKEKLLEDGIWQGTHKTAALSGICCLSEIGDNPLMWAHYGDNLRGVCLIFDTTRLLRTSRYALHKVRYLKRIPKYDYFKYIMGIRRDPSLKHRAKRNHDHETEMHAVKKHDWAYEREQRLISDTRGKIYYPEGSLVGIVLGPRTSAYDTIRLVKASYWHRTHLRILQAWADKKSKSFKLFGAGRTFRFLSEATVTGTMPKLLERDRSISLEEMMSVFSTVTTYDDLS